MVKGLDEMMQVQVEALRLRSYRQEVLAANLANADTPNYKAVDFDFGAALREATAARPGSAPGAAQPPPLLYRTPAFPGRRSPPPSKGRPPKHSDWLSLSQRMSRLRAATRCIRATRCSRSPAVPPHDRKP